MGKMTANKPPCTCQVRLIRAGNGFYILWHCHEKQVSRAGMSNYITSHSLLVTSWAWVWYVTMCFWFSLIKYTGIVLCMCPVSAIHWHRVYTEWSLSIASCYFANVISSHIFMLITKLIGMAADIYTPCFNEVDRGYTGFTLSVCSSVRLCPLCIFNNTHRIHFIFAHLIKQSEKVCHL